MLLSLPPLRENPPRPTKFSTVYSTAEQDQTPAQRTRSCVQELMFETDSAHPVTSELITSVLKLNVFCTAHSGKEIVGSISKSGLNFLLP